MPEIIIEKLLEQRDFYLNTLKHLDFQLMIYTLENEPKDIEQLQNKTIDQIKKWNKELHSFYIQNNNRLQ